MNQSQINEILLQLAKFNNLRHTADDDDHDHDSHEHNDDDSDLNNVNIAKGTAMAVLFGASTLCGCIPFILNKWLKWTENNPDARSATVVKCLLYFGGGVLLATTFLHLLPEINEQIEGLQESGRIPHMSFSLAPLLMCLGFFTMFFVEECVHLYIHKHQQSLDNNSAEIAFERGKSVRDSYLVKGRRKSSNVSAKDDNIASTKAGGLSVQDLITNDVENQKYQSQDTTNTNNTDIERNNEPTNNNNNRHDHHHHQHHQHHHHDHGHSHGHSHLPITTNANEDMIVSSLRGLLIVLALSLHELFEGLAVGLQKDAGTVWMLFGAVSAHKLVLAFCVGVELIVTKTRLWLAIVYVVTFAIVSPIGIGIGILISSEGSAATAIPSTILQGLATGTLLYVVFFEILSKERSGLIAWAAFIIGFFVMFGLQLATGHHHSHGEGGGHTHDHDHGHSHGDHDHADHDDEDASHKSLDDQLKMLREAANGFTNAFTKKVN